MARGLVVLAGFAALVLATAPAAAQGSFNPGSKPRGFAPATPAPKPKLHETPNAPLPKPPPTSKTRAPDLTQPAPFKPYEPWKPASVFGPDGKPRK